MGRLVKTHSTYIEGLIPRLEALACNSKIRTISPGVISKAGGRCESLTLRVSRKIRGGYKINARKGSSSQEVYIITSLSQEELIEKIKTCSL